MKEIKREERKEKRKRSMHTFVVVVFVMSEMVLEKIMCGVCVCPCVSIVG